VKSLILLRHGKSDRPAGMADHERPLAQRGRRAAEAMGRFVAAAGQVPDVAATSTAVRARDTLRIACEAGRWSCRVREDPALYDALPGAVLGVVRAEDAGTERLLLVGHEPTLSETLALLVGGGSLRFPTAAALLVELDVGAWDEVAPGTGELAWLLPPRLLHPAADPEARGP